MEAAIKFARKRGFKMDPHKTQIVSFKKGFHGRSSGALSITEKPQYREQYGPLVDFGPDARRFVYLNDVAAFDAAMSDHVCAVVVEPIQGEGGVNSATPQFLRHIRESCTRHGALMIVDEVQCGLGRTGNLWAHTLAFPENNKLAPDMLTMAKPLAGGIAAGAVLCNRESSQHLAPGDHGSTFAGSPLSSAAAIHVLDRVSRPEFLKGVEVAGQHLRSRLFNMETMNVRGRGLISGFDVDPSRSSSDIVLEARDRGLLIHSAGPHTIRLIPALNITLDELDEGLDILSGVLASKV
jgi:acetylornithine aminotransferase